MKIYRSVDIAASSKQIWPFLVEPAKISKWCSPAKMLDRTGDQNSGPGTSFYFEERAVGRLMKLHFVVTEWVVNERVAFKMTAGNFVKGYEQRYTIESISSGSRCTCYEYVNLPYGILGHIALLFRRRYSMGLLDGMLGRLKILAEA
jgi:uncharacterized protein YndB with AHSA1/START domain